MDRIRKIYLTVKYVIQGDSWEDAWAWAGMIVDNWKGRKLK